MTLHVAGASLDWALAHIKSFGDTDIFPVAYEFEAIEMDWERVRAYLTNQDLDTWTTRAYRECFSPKGRYSYRVSTQLDPLDALVYLGVAYEMGAQLEQYRVPADEQVVFSHRFAPDANGQMYDSKVGWSSFATSSAERASLQSVKYVVLADISDFYHRVYHHSIENMLNTATGDSAQGRVVMKLLSQWRGKPSFGIPVGPIALAPLGRSDHRRRR